MCANILNLSAVLAGRTSVRASRVPPIHAPQRTRGALQLCVAVCSFALQQRGVKSTHSTLPMITVKAERVCAVDLHAHIMYANWAVSQVAARQTEKAASS